MHVANALDQLDVLVQEKKYAETSQTLAVSLIGYFLDNLKNRLISYLQAVKELSAPFKSYLGIPRVALQWARIQTLQGEIRSKLDREFDAL